MALNKVPYTEYQTVVTAQNLNDIQDAIISTTGYAVCDTAAAVQAKSASCPNYVLSVGSAIKVKFTYSNTAADPTIDINSTGAKAIKKYGSVPAGTSDLASWSAGEVVELVYDGTNYVMVGKNREVGGTDVGVGTLSSLTTTNKSDLVSAVNEVNAGVTADKCLVLDVGTVSSLPFTFPSSGTNSNITTDLVCVRAELGTPSAQTGDWTINTNTVGKVIISGTISGSTTCKLYMMKSR